MLTIMPIQAAESLQILDTFFRVSVEKYHDMVAAGIITRDDRVELLEGALIVKMGQNPPHRTAVIRLTRVFSRLPLVNHFPQFQAPITLERSEPEPDGAIITGSEEQYLTENPGQHAVRLVVEIADASLRQDRNLKRRIYATAGIPEYWIVNVTNRTVEVHSDPVAANSDYQSVKVYGNDAHIELALKGEALAHIAVGDIIL